ncbi:MAG: hypothetical protein IV100_12230 [Myxococcales bacterium]|nr:hypothetical protein [Myxococcales bacterium]
METAEAVSTTNAYVLTVGSQNAYAKVALERYYDDAGTAGHVKLAFAPVDAPDSDSVRVPATDGTDGTGCDALHCGHDDVSDVTAGGTVGSDGRNGTDGSDGTPPPGVERPRRQRPPGRPRSSRPVR